MRTSICGLSRRVDTIDTGNNVANDSAMSLARPAQPPTILVIEDDMDARRMYADYLRANGCLAFTASDGRSGIDKATDLCPDVVVLDLAMPRVDGWTVLKQVRESSWTEHIPIVVVT